VKHSKVLKIIILLVFCIEIVAQSRIDLEKQKQKTQSEIEYASKLLSGIRVDHRNTINQLNIINKRIAVRNEFIQTISSEVNLLSSKLDEKNTVLALLQEDLEQIKNDYASIIVHTYWSLRAYDKLMFILSASNFNQAYKRLKYLKQYSEYRKRQAVLIEEFSGLIQSEVSSIAILIKQKQRLLNDKETEKKILLDEEKQGKEVANELKKKENQLKKEIENKKRVARELENTIKKIIEEEARKAREQNVTSRLTPEEKLISDNFGKNKGRLPWPTSQGIITNEFGKQPHPVLKGIMIENNGVDINTVKDAQVRAVFDGVVTKIIAIKGANFTVIIRHGNYLSVYQNLINVTVKQGDKIAVKQVIGSVFYDETTNTSTLHFEIWNELLKQNPKEWLTRQ
jgi:murein hydrolase activator